MCTSCCKFFLIVIITNSYVLTTQKKTIAKFQTVLIDLDYKSTTKIHLMYNKVCLEDKLHSSPEWKL